MKTEHSTGNVFGDLGFSPKEAESLRLRAELMVELGAPYQGTQTDAERGGETLRSHPAT